MQEPLRGSIAAPLGVGVLAPTGEVRQRIAAALAAANIEVRPVGGGNMARQPFLAGRRFGPFPVADRIHDLGFQVPNGPHLIARDVRHVVNVIAEVL